MVKLNDSENICPFDVYLWPFGIAVFLGGLISIFGNTIIIYAVIRSSELKNKCYLLMGILATSDLISSIAFVSYGLFIFLEFTCENASKVMTLWSCFLINIPFVLSLNSGCFMIFVVGFDRFLSLWNPTYYLSLDKTSYVRFWGCLSFFYSCIFFVLGFIFGYKDDNFVPTCVLPTSLADIAMKVWAQANVLLNLIVIVTYSLTFWKAEKLRQNRHSRNAERQLRVTEKVMRSISIVMLVYILTWFATMLTIFLVTSVFQCSPSVIFHSSLYVGILANLNVGSNFFIYLARSQEYRRAFTAILCCQKALLSRRSTFVSVSRSRYSLPTGAAVPFRGDDTETNSQNGCVTSL